MEKRVLVVGCNGRMGKLVCEAISNSEDFIASAGYDVKSEGNIFPIYTSVEELNFNPFYDSIIDFSRPAATMEILEDFAVKNGIPMVIATTGFEKDQLKAIEDAAQKIPIFMSSNMSRGIYLANQLVYMASTLLTDYNDVSIDELHHIGKKDAPSGTAINIFFGTINRSRGNNLVPAYGKTDKKQPNEVWMSSRRIGKASGLHTITFAGESDEISIVHNAYDASIFAKGALDAARYIVQQTEPRIYTMDDLFNE